MIGIIAAIDAELAAVKELMQVESEEEIAGRILYTGTIENQPVCLMQSGVGKAAAAMSATICCMKYDLKALINVGVAGGLRDEQHVMDIVLSDEAVQADFDLTALEGPEAIGLTFKADEKLLEQAQKLLYKLELPFHTGLIASQDLFMAREEDFDKLMANFPNSACSEMEGAAVASVAQAFHVPFLIIRSLSDVVHHKDNPMEFSKFAAIAAHRAAVLIEGICLENDIEQ